MFQQESINSEMKLVQYHRVNFSAAISTISHYVVVVPTLQGGAQSILIKTAIRSFKKGYTFLSLTINEVLNI